MPDEKNQTTPPPETPSSPTPPTGTPGAEPAEYRYPNDPTLPEWARGKSATEILGLTQQLVEERVRGMPPPPPQATAPVAQAGDEDYVTGKDLRALRQSATAEIQPMIQQSLAANAQMAYSIAKRDHKEMFGKYEPEIIQVLGRVPREQWTLDVIENAVKFVRGNHVDEIAEEKARRLVSQMEPTIRSTGSGGSTPVTRSPDSSLDSEKIPAGWRERARQAGITEREVQELCWANEMTPEQFFKQFDVVTDAVTEVSITGQRVR